MGTRKQREHQEPLWYRTELAEAPGHPFYRRLNQVLEKAGFDWYCEEQCREHYHKKLGRPSLVPGVIGPEPGGLTYFQAIEIIDGVADRATIVGFDVVEFVPERDVNGIGALTTFRLAAHAIGRISRQRANAAATA